MRLALLSLLLLSCTKPAPEPQARALNRSAPAEPIGMDMPAREPAQVTNLSGIWEGNLGTQPIRACFVEESYGPYGAYFTLSRLRLVGLHAVDGAPGSYSEWSGDPNAPVWRDVTATATTLTAHWTGGGRTQQVQLRRLAGADAGGEDGPCASIAFHRPRLAGVRTVRTRASVDGVPYTKLNLDTRGHFEIQLETFALDGDSPAVRRINATLSEGLGGDPPGWFDCVRGSLDHQSLEGGSSDTLAPVLISRRWLSVTSQGNTACGGAHPTIMRLYQLYDLSSGAPVEVLDWFLPSAVTRQHVEGDAEDWRSLSPAFRDFVLTYWHPEGAAQADCGRIIREQASWNAGLVRRGIVFRAELPQVFQACEEEFTIPFERLRPWLNPEGAAAVAALQAERRG